MKPGFSLLALAAVAAFAGVSAVRADDTRVLVIPFNTLNVPAGQQWIGKGVQENLVADLGRSGECTPVAFQGSVIVEDNATAARLARGAGTQLAIRGTAQVVGEEVRLTAQLLDARNGEIVRTALVTGEVSNLLKLEDELSAQLTTPPEPVVVSIPATPPVVPPTQVIVVSQPEQGAYSPYGYYGYGDYSQGYYAGYYPVIVTTSPGIRHEHDGHDGPGRGGNSGGGAGGGHGRGGNAGGNPGGVVVPVSTTHVNPTALPIPTNAAVMPIPTSSGNVLPVPTSSHR